MVNTTRILKSRLSGIRRCPWKISQPDVVVSVRLTPKGNVSNDEA